MQLKESLNRLVQFIRAQRGFMREERAQSEWNSVYLLIVFIIAAILIIALVKPMFKQSQDIVKAQPVLADKK